MSGNQIIKIDKMCMDRCRFKANNCWMHEDGTWDCAAKIEDCFEPCTIKS